MPEKDKLFLLFLKREKNYFYSAFWSRFCISRQLLKFPPACRAGKQPKSCAEGATEAFGAEKGIISCAEGATEAFGAEKSIYSCAEWDTTRLPSRKMLPILRGRCHGGIWSRKMHLFLRGIGYNSPAEQKITPIPARRVLQGGSEQKKASFPAQKGPQPRQGPRGGECVKWYFSALYFVFVTKNDYICKIIFVNAQ